jgi:hypothetical protein
MLKTGDYVGGVLNRHLPASSALIALFGAADEGERLAQPMVVLTSIEAGSPRSDLARDLHAFAPTAASRSCAVTGPGTSSATSHG